MFLCLVPVKKFFLIEEAAIPLTFQITCMGFSHDRDDDCSFVIMQISLLSLIFCVKIV